MIKRAVWFLLCVSVVRSQSPETSVTPSQREMVLTENVTVTVSPLPHRQAVFPRGGDIPFTGTLQISAGSRFARSYTWDGETRKVDLWPRDTRWNGNFGAYYPGPGSHWRSNHGITRGVLQEGQMEFDTVEDAQRWLSSKPYAVYTHDGLVVDFKKNSGGGGTLIVDLWQILIGKQRPATLKGSHDELISMSGQGQRD